MSYILYVVDTETTGLDPNKNEIIELSMCRFQLNEPEEKHEIKTWLLKAMNPETVEDSALRISKHKREDILHLTKFGQDNYKNPSKLLPEIENWIASDDFAVDERIMVGQNVLFDYEMMLSLWEKNNNRDTFPFQTGPNKNVLDTKSLALLIDVCVGKKRDRYALGTLVKAFGIKKRKAHQAETDALMTRDLFIKQITPLISIIKECFNDCYEDNL